MEDRVDSPPPVPHDLPIDRSFDIENSMLRNVFLVTEIPLPTPKASLQASREPILVNDHIVLFVEPGVPDDAIDDVCVGCSAYDHTRLCFQVPDAGRSLFSIEGDSFGVGLVYVSSAGLGLVS